MAKKARNEADLISLFLGSRASKKGKIPRTAADKVSECLLEEFGAENIINILRDRETPIDMKWYVDMLQAMFMSSPQDVSSATKLEILRELKQLMVSGAIQGSELSTFIQDSSEKGQSSPAKPITPFEFEMPKLARKAK